MPWGSTRSLGKAWWKHLQNKLPLLQAYKICLREILHFNQYEYDQKRHLKKIIPEFTFCQSNNNTEKHACSSFLPSKYLKCSLTRKNSMCLFSRWVKHIYFDFRIKRKKKNLTTETRCSLNQFITSNNNATVILTLLYMYTLDIRKKKQT